MYFFVLLRILIVMLCILIDMFVYSYRYVYSIPGIQFRCFVLCTVFA
jgi:hypothetical protein